MSEEGKKSPSWDWSSKHTRLRFQLVATSIVLFSLSHYHPKMDTLSLPFSILEYNDGPSQIQLICFFVVLYLFTLLCFVVRTLNERNKFSYEEYGAIQKIEEVRKLFSSIYGVIQKSFQFEKMDSNHPYHKWSQSIYERGIQETYDSSHFDEVKIALRDARSLLANSIEYYVKERRSFDRNPYAPSGILESDLSKVSSSLERVEAHSDEFLKSIGDHCRSGTHMMKLLNDQFEKGTALIREANVELLATKNLAEQVVARASALEAEARKKAKFFRFERDWAGAWLPIAVSLVFFVLSFKT